MRTPSEHVAHAGTTTWKVRYRLAGRQSSLTFYGSTGKADATKFCKMIDLVGVDHALAHLDETTGNRAHVEVLTLDTWAERHIDTLTGVTEGTRDDYRKLYARTWSPIIGSLPITLVTRDAVARGVNDLSARYSDKSVANAHGLLAAMMKAAMRDDLIDKSPCADIRLPRRTEHETAEMRFLTQAEFDDLLHAIPTHWQPLILCLVGTGVRWGEASAFTVGDVDLAVDVVRVTKSIQRGTRAVGPPKTRKSRRTITLPPQVADALTPLVTGRPRTSPLFVGPKGAPLQHRNFWSDVWRPAVERAGLHPRPRIHDLRHTHTAWLVAANIPLPVIQSRLGHESITTTIDTYGHLLPDLQAAAAHAALAALDGIKPRLLAG
jgi:integrase